jgi:hypothetical protein
VEKATQNLPSLKTLCAELKCIYHSLLKPLLTEKVPKNSSLQSLNLIESQKPFLFRSSRATNKLSWNTFKNNISIQTVKIQRTSPSLEIKGLSGFSYSFKAKQPVQQPRNIPPFNVQKICSYKRAVRVVPQVSSCSLGNHEECPLNWSQNTILERLLKEYESILRRNKNIFLIEIYEIKKKFKRFENGKNKIKISQYIDYVFKESISNIKSQISV